MTEGRPAARKWKSYPHTYHTKKKTSYDYYPTSHPKDRHLPWEEGDWPSFVAKKSELDRLQRIRLNQGGLPLNWLKTFGYSYNGLKNLLIMLNLPIPKERNKHPKHKWPEGYPPYGEKPEKIPYDTPYIYPKPQPRYKEWEYEE